MENSPKMAERRMREHAALHEKFAEEGAFWAGLARHIVRDGGAWRCLGCLKRIHFRKPARLRRHCCCKPGIRSWAVAKVLRRALKQRARAQAHVPRRRGGYCLRSVRRRLRSKRACPWSEWKVLPAGLAYNAIGERVKNFRAQMEPLTRMHAGVGYRPNLLPNIDGENGSNNMGIGRFLYSEETGRYACIVDAPQDGTVPVIFFRRISTECRPCPRHGKEGRPCWRVTLPMRPVRITMSSAWRSSPGLIARLGGAEGAVDIVRFWQRCFQEVGEMEPSHQRPVDPCELMQGLITEASEELASGVTVCRALADEASAVFQGVACVVVKHVDAAGQETTPTFCPASASSAGARAPGSRTAHGCCKVKFAGFRPGRMVVGAQGARKSLCRRYRCIKHGYDWVASCVDADASVRGDAVGQKYVIQGDFWPGCLRVFEDTENYEAVRRHLWGCTMESMERRIAANPLVRGLADFEKAIMHRAFTRHLQEIPVAHTLADWMSKFVRPGPTDISMGWDRGGEFRSCPRTPPPHPGKNLGSGSGKFGVSP